MDGLRDYQSARCTFFLPRDSTLESSLVSFSFAFDLSIKLRIMSPIRDRDAACLAFPAFSGIGSWFL